MTYADVVNQMQAVQAQMLQLQQLLGAAPASTSTANASSFAAALDDATGTADAAPTAPSASAAPTAATTSTGAAAATTPTVPTSASTDGSAVDANGVTGDDVVQAALQYKGVPYVYGGESKSGIDCSGLVQAAFSSLGVSVPRTVTGQETVGESVPSLKDAKPGDLIVLDGGNHIAIYMGNDTVIHAPYPGRTVSVQKDWFTDKDITTIRRIVPATGGSSTTSSLDATSSTGTSSTGLSPAATAQATALLAMYGADAGLYGSSDGSSGDSSSSSTSLSSLLSSFGISGSDSTAATDPSSSLLSAYGLTGSGSSGSSTATQQLLAARAALLEASA